VMMVGWLVCVMRRRGDVCSRVEQTGARGERDGGERESVRHIIKRRGKKQKKRKINEGGEMMTMIRQRCGIG